MRRSRIARQVTAALLFLILCPAARALATAERVLTVSPDGRGDYTSIQAAFDAIPEGNTVPHVVRVRPGVYAERLTLARGKRFVSLVGEGDASGDVAIRYSLSAREVIPPSTQPVGTSGSSIVFIHADDFSAENITFENSAGDVGQAVAVKITGDRVVFRNCRFIGWQDTLYPSGGRVYFERCHIEGRVDFIFGKSTAVFDRCTIHSKNGGYITAANTPPEQPFGFVFLDCVLTGEGAPAYLGRPWQWDRGSKAAVAFLRCEMGSHVKPEGWNRWDRPENPNLRPAENTRYYEYRCTGPGSARAGRVEWSRTLTDEEASAYTVQNVLAGSDGWNPTAGR